MALEAAIEEIFDVARSNRASDDEQYRRLRALGCAPLQHLALVAKARNRLVHYTPETIERFVVQRFTEGSVHEDAGDPFVADWCAAAGFRRPRSNDVFALAQALAHPKVGAWAYRTVLDAMRLVGSWLQPPAGPPQLLVHGSRDPFWDLDITP